MSLLASLRPLRNAPEVVPMCFLLVASPAKHTTGTGRPPLSTVSGSPRVSTSSLVALEDTYEYEPRVKGFVPHLLLTICTCKGFLEAGYSYTSRCSTCMIPELAPYHGRQAGEVLTVKERGRSRAGKASSAALIPTRNCSSGTSSMLEAGWLDTQHTQDLPVLLPSSPSGTGPPFRTAVSCCTWSFT